MQECTGIFFYYFLLLLYLLLCTLFCVSMVHRVGVLEMFGAAHHTKPLPPPGT